MPERSVREECLNRDHVVSHGAVTHRTTAAGVVAGHASNRGARGGRDIDRKPQSVRLELSIQLIEDDAWLDRAAATLDIEIENSRQVFRTVDDERSPHGLSGLRRAASTCQNRRP